MKGHIGIDEVGRGPLAGPALVCGVLWISPSDPGEILEGIRDSKKLTPRKRMLWKHRADKLTESHLLFATCSADSKEIDREGIVQALQKASTEVIKKLQEKGKIKHIYADYGLPLAELYPKTHLIKGDEKNPLISLASIIAKEARDEIMRNLDKEFPAYGFGKHKGYGTKQHREMIQLHGTSPIHRRTFLRNII